MISSDGQVCWNTGYDRCLEALFWSLSLAWEAVELILSVCLCVCPCASRVISSKQFTCLYWKISKATVSVCLSVCRAPFTIRSPSRALKGSRELKRCQFRAVVRPTQTYIICSVLGALADFLQQKNDSSSAPILGKFKKFYFVLSFFLGCRVGTEYKMVEAQ